VSTIGLLSLRLDFAATAGARRPVQPQVVEAARKINLDTGRKRS
jgi:hypothetical protein